MWRSIRYQGNATIHKKRTQSTKPTGVVARELLYFRNSSDAESDATQMVEPITNIICTLRPNSANNVASNANAPTESRIVKGIAKYHFIMP